MSLIRQLPEIIENAEEEYAVRKENPSKPQRKTVFQQDGGTHPAGTFILGDNAAVLEHGVASGELLERFDMIYCDPPFFTRGDKGVRIPVCSEIVPETKEVRLRAYHDRWNSGMSGYLSELALRLMFMRDALKETGSIFVHLDWHASHVVRLLMDEIFGQSCFVNEIIWSYKSGGAAKRHLSRKHDNILFYSKSRQYKFYPQKEKSYNRGLKPYHFAGVTEYQDETGWYTLVNQKDVWQIDMVGRSSAERLNYATQKPEALLKRMIELVTDEGDLCGDFYCGSGTLAAAAMKENRQFVCADVSPLAMANAVKRPLKEGCPFIMEDWSGRGLPDCTVSAFREGSRVILEHFRGPHADRVSRRDREKMEDILSFDPFALVDYWCAGVTGRDGIFHVRRTVFRDKKGLASRVMEDVPSECNSVRVTDIFGQSACVFLP